jgi:hypothetical protein
MPEKMSECVTIHGDKMKLADIKESIEWAREQTWKKKKWIARAALISNGRSTEYVGQKYDPKYTKLVENGWTHDHCEICWWTLWESENPDEGEGYTTDGHHWVCKECYKQFINVKA